MQKPVVVIGDGQSFQDVLAEVRVRHPELKFSSTPVSRALEQEFGTKAAAEIRRGAKAMSFRSPED